MKINKGVLIMACILILFGGLISKQFIISDKIVLRRWMYSDGGMILTGLPALAVIILVLGLGVYGLYMLFKNNQKNVNVFQIGTQQVVVKNKNKSWGALNSLDLTLPNGQLLTFYCTAGRVAAMLLNDFVVGQEATLKISTEDGKDCDLTSKNASAHGLIRS